MVASIGNKKYVVQNPAGANPYTAQTHNNNKTGTDAYVIMWITMANTVNY